MPDTTQRPRGRPIGGSAIDRSDIVKATLDAIAQGGYVGLTMRGVARSVGASLATVQRHFPTKDELWRAAIDDFLDGFDELSLDGPGDPLERGIDGVLGRGSIHPGLAATLLADHAPGFEERHRYLADRLQARQARSAILLGKLQDQGAMRRVDTGVFLLLLTIGIGALASTTEAVRSIYGLDLADDSDRSQVVESLADILRHGVVAPVSERSSGD